jgi:hypothetical protein
VPDILRNDGEYFDYTLTQIRTRGFCHIRFAEYREGGLAVPLVVGGRIVGGVVMRYIKSTLKTDQIEHVYFPILRKLTEDISAAYEARISQRRLQSERENSQLRINRPSALQAAAAIEHLPI